MTLNFNWIVNGVAQGGIGNGSGASDRWTPTTLAEGFRHADVIVFCAEEKQPPKNFRPPPGKVLYRLGFDDDIYQPIPAEAGQIFHKAASQLATYVRSGRRILITCAMGLNRSGLITALTLMYAFRMSPNDAIGMIRGRRAKDALMNPIFENWIRAQRVR